MTNRLICAVLDEMRACWKTRNFAPLNGLVEEAQSLANRMESAIEDNSKYYRIDQETINKLKRKKRRLEWKIDDLESKKEKLEFEIEEKERNNN